MGGVITSATLGTSNISLKMRLFFSNWVNSRLLLVEVTGEAANIPGKQGMEETRMHLGAIQNIPSSYHVFWRQQKT